MKSSIFAFSLFVTATTLSLHSGAQQQKSRIRPVIPYAHAKITAPPGMVYIPGGSTIIKYSQQSTDSNCVKKVSLSSYFIDKTEVTNQQYRQFVEWVIDSIAITRYLSDGDYFKDAKVVDSTNSNVVTVRRINWSKVDHKKLFEGDTRSKLMAMLDERGQIKKDSILFAYSYLRAIGTNPKAKVGTYATKVVGVYPDEQIWAKDLPNAQTDIFVENYFTSPPYDDYPVVGVTWDQAMAYTYWRSLTSNGYSDVADYMKNYHLSFSLPSEAQWVYAAQQDMRSSVPVTPIPAEEVKDKTKKEPVAKNETPHDTTGDGARAVMAADPNSSWSATTSTTTDNSAALVDTNAFFDPTVGDDKTNVPADRKGLTANFKQDEGDYTGDGSPFTVPVMSYAPNDFGVYNMIGNVAEWTMDAYSPSAFAFVSDINPVLKYDADSSDVQAMKRKVVRGGSFVSNAKALSPYARDYELMDVAHCFIGFRCVMGAPEILSKEVSTRKKSSKRK